MPKSTVLLTSPESEYAGPPCDMCEAFAERFTALESRMAACLEASEQAAKEKEEPKASQRPTRHSRARGAFLEPAQESQAAALQAETLQQAQDAKSVAYYRAAFVFVSLKSPRTTTCLRTAYRPSLSCEHARKS